MNTLPLVTGPWDGWGHHMGGGGPGWLWGVLMMLVWIGLVVSAVWLVTRVLRLRSAERSGPEHAREVLAVRYARGEISIEEYQERLTHLGRV